ncbi:2-C-methyl-D-erythritol 4-phosphate cytidylyltransferase [Algiphilus sp. W345]|uniref:2-C-methyl-D-erythritol 4-phosphate cytidylyltransferase n=1 Tax=Banduia mediterranea TaxID=3075609 RepID=A0ABU2WMB5_9GAMM|nr:2-C-methyl-D-erythritol 4-phosphate cytidylyltransferase [Algiphilus sp. W345]MDT0499024.1 2-C-methyl-D-erythritol 4-phosphate cytidylyltransferase [Algiphilus sp. W345]
MASTPRYWAVVVAAGNGSRMAADRPKQYLPLAGRCVIEWSLAPFLDCDWIAGIVVVLAAADCEFAKLPVSRDDRVFSVDGGASRAESVLCGLRWIEANAGKADGRSYALVHDAARPCLRQQDLDRLRDLASNADGGLLAVPVTDTLKREAQSRVDETISRDALWRAQTPQLFELSRLVQALEVAASSGLAVTDDASAMEAIGARPHLVRGSGSNIKITHAEDLALAEFWLNRQGGSD